MLAASLTHTMVSSLPGCVDHLLSLCFFNCSSSSEDESAGEREEESAVRNKAACCVETSEVPASNTQTGECQRNGHRMDGGFALSFPPFPQLLQWHGY